MNISGLLPLIESLPAFEALAAALRAQPTVTAEVIEAARSPMLAALSRSLDAPIVVLTARSDRAKQLADELNVWRHESGGVSIFPEPDPLFYERMPWNAETIAARLGAFAALAQSRGARSASKPIIVSSVRALMQRTVPPSDFLAAVRVLRRGESKSLIELLSSLVTLGYEYEVVVETPGAFSRRGGILDIWPPSVAQPVRIEFAGDEIAPLRAFDPATQRSAEQIDVLTIIPASEALPGRGSEAVRALAKLDLA
ncbi:MAG TPA: transcription-repair coupling factor, partial [Anaerolineae bacterium]